MPTWVSLPGLHFASFLPFLLFLADANRSKSASNYDVCVRPQWPREGLCALRLRLHLTGRDCRTCLWGWWMFWKLSTKRDVYCI